MCVYTLGNNININRMLRTTCVDTLPTSKFKLPKLSVGFIIRCDTVWRALLHLLRSRAKVPTCTDMTVIWWRGACCVKLVLLQASLVMDSVKMRAGARLAH